MSSIATRSGDEVELQSASGDVFGSVFEAMRREGFDAGYARAKHDVLAELVYVAEQLLQREGAEWDGTQRALLYAFIERVQHSLGESLSAAGYVEDGLGI